MPKGVYVRTAEHCRQISESSKRTWSNPEYKKKFSEALKKAMNTPGARKRNSESKKKAWSNPEKRQKSIEAFNTSEAKKNKSEALKKVWSGLEGRQKYIESMNTLEAKKKLSEAKKKYNYDGPLPEYHSKIREVMFEMLGDKCVECGKHLRDVKYPIPHKSSHIYLHLRAFDYLVQIGRISKYTNWFLGGIQ